ncbi:MAG: hypothetical protein Q7V88_10275 [Actinomycetota bacterium]|nr:hypothetical protein [Actinomycetota bacterium]
MNLLYGRVLTATFVGGLSLGLVACSDDPSGAAPTSTTVLPGDGGSSTTAAEATSPPTTVSLNHFQITVTGAYSLDVEGAGGYCNYFVPDTQRGLVYSVSSAEIGETGWDLQVQGNSPTEVGVLLNTVDGSFANDAAAGGVINAGADLHHADFDLDLVSMADQTVIAHITGSIDCA